MAGRLADQGYDSAITPDVAYPAACCLADRLATTDYFFDKIRNILFYATTNSLRTNIPVDIILVI